MNARLKWSQETDLRPSLSISGSNKERPSMQLRDTCISSGKNGNIALAKYFEKDLSLIPPKITPIFSLLPPNRVWKHYQEYFMMIRLSTID